MANNNTKVSPISSAKPPVVLVHGMWSTPETLSDLKNSFERQGYEVFVPRLPYHFAKNEMTAATRESLASAKIEEYTSSLISFIQGLDEEPILVGHSMGALLAQLVAAKIKARKLILISSAPPAGINGWTLSVIRTLGHNLLKFPLWSSTTNLLLRNIQYGIAHVQSAAIHKEIVRKSTFESGMAATQIGMWFLYRKPPTRVDYERIRCPVLIIAGSEDRITPVSIQRKICKRFSGRANLMEIEGCDHWTIGGKYFDEIQSHIYSWLGHNQGESASVSEKMVA